MACCEVPCWSGLWLETETIGFMEISDLDERTHRPPPGWSLVDVQENVLRSSQIFRYVKADVTLTPLPLVFDRLQGLLFLASAAGCSPLAHPIIEAIIRKDIA